MLFSNRTEENKIFIPVISLAFIAITIAQFTPLGGQIGIGIAAVSSLLIAQGADPVIAGALAMTAGYCGTLMTPMAANFNALPVALLEMKNPNGVIKEQLPYALIMIAVHITLMYFWAF